MSDDQNPQSRDTIEVQVDEGLNQWLAALKGSLAITTYQAGKLVLLGHDGNGLSVLLRQFDKPMGLAVKGDTLAIGTRHDVQILANARLLAPDYQHDQPDKYDALFTPRLTYHTGDLAVHDLAFDADGELWVVNTRFCCLARLSRDYNFIPKWKPPFVTEVVPEDRCHLNGLAMVDGRPGYVTCLGETDSPGEWRAGKATGGCVVHVESNQVIVRGLAMPHSPRWYKDQLWVLNSGAGELWAIDVKSGRHVVVAALPSYLRGMDFVGPYAVIGMCQIREKHIFGGLPIQQRQGDRLSCGVTVVDLRTGQQVGSMTFTSGCTELFEVRVLPGIRRPMVLNLEREAARQAFSAPEFSYWLRPQNVVADFTHATS